MKKIYLFFCMIPSIVSYSQSSCPNLDFSYGDFTNWQVFYSTNGYIIMNAASGQFYDEYCSLIPKVPNGYNFSCRIGGGSIFQYRDAIGYELTIDSNSPFLIVSFAWVLGICTYVQFYLKIEDSTGNTIPCGNFSIVDPKDKMQGAVCMDTIIGKAARPWTTIGYNMESFIGQTLKIYFELENCAAHNSYVYVVADCRPAVTELPLCSEQAGVRLEAPEGFESYQWTRSSDPSWTNNRQAFRIPTPDDGEIFTCTVSSLGCETEIKYKIKKTIIDAYFAYGVMDTNGHVPIVEVEWENGYDTCSRTATFVDLSKVINGVKDSIIWRIMTTNTLKDSIIAVSSDSLFTYTFPEPPTNNPVTYKVCLWVFTKDSCRDTVCQNITIYPTPQVKIEGDDRICTGDSAWLKAVPIQSGFSSHQWSWLDEKGVTQTVTGDSIKIYTRGIYMLESLSHGCMANDTFTVTALKTTITSYPTICGETNGKLILEITEGIFPYQFKIEKEDGTLVSSSDTAWNLSVGNHIVTVTDAVNCVTSDTVTIAATPTPYI